MMLRDEGSELYRHSITLGVTGQCLTSDTLVIHLNIWQLLNED